MRGGAVALVLACWGLVWMPPGQVAGTGPRGTDGRSAHRAGLLARRDFLMTLLSVNVEAAPVTTAPVARTEPVTSAPPALSPRPVRITDWLRSEDGRLSVPVGFYDDATGQAPVPRDRAVLDLAMRQVPYYFDGHNPGLFTALLAESPGAVLDYWDHRGRLHRFRIAAIRTWRRSAGEPPPLSPRVEAQFQTCRTADGSVDWIYDAVAA